jgi:hypothetical protein
MKPFSPLAGRMPDTSSGAKEQRKLGSPVLVWLRYPGLGTYWAYWNSGIAFNASFVAPGRTNFLSTNLN